MTTFDVGRAAREKVMKYAVGLAIFMRRATSEEITRWASFGQDGKHSEAADVAYEVVRLVDEDHAKVLREFTAIVPTTSEFQTLVTDAMLGSDGPSAALMRNGAILSLGLMLRRAEAEFSLPLPREQPLVSFLREKEDQAGPCPQEVMELATRANLTVGDLLKAAEYADAEAVTLIGALPS